MGCRQQSLLLLQYFLNFLLTYCLAEPENCYTPNMFDSYILFLNQTGFLGQKIDY